MERVHRSRHGDDVPRCLIRLEEQTPYTTAVSVARNSRGLLRPLCAERCRRAQVNVHAAADVPEAPAHLAPVARAIPVLLAFAQLQVSMGQDILLAIMNELVATVLV